MQPSCNTDHVVEVVAVRQPGSQKDAPHVYVVGDVGTGQFEDRNIQVSSEDLDRHRGLFLPDAVEGAQLCGEVGGPWLTGPYRQIVDVAVEGRRLRHGGSSPIGLGGDADRIEMA
jgi:hypothetical protein